MSWRVDPSHGDYIMIDGKPVDDESLKYPAYYRTKATRGKWLHAPDDKWGSDFGNLKKRFNGGDLNGLANIQRQALQPMIDDGRAIAINVSFVGQQQGSRNNSELHADITSANGITETLVLPPVGE